MTTLTIDLQLSTEQIEQLNAMAQVRQAAVPETLQLAVTEWLEQQWQHHLARQKLRSLGQGLGTSSGPHDKAQRHDQYLYPPKAVS